MVWRLGGARHGGQAKAIRHENYAFCALWRRFQQRRNRAPTWSWADFEGAGPFIQVRQGVRNAMGANIFLIFFNIGDPSLAGLGICASRAMGETHRTDAHDSSPAS